jgi:hypothetical protein
LVETRPYLPVHSQGFAPVRKGLRAEAVPQTVPIICKSEKTGQEPSFASRMATSARCGGHVSVHDLAKYLILLVCDGVEVG